MEIERKTEWNIFRSIIQDIKQSSVNVYVPINARNGRKGKLKRVMTIMNERSYKTQGMFSSENEEDIF
jgi:hypothetical protein